MPSSKQTVDKEERKERESSTSRIEKKQSFVKNSMTDESVENVKTYLKQWSLKNREKENTWKFHKRTQKRIQALMFQKDVLNKNYFDMACKYFTESKGAARDAVIADARRIIDDDERASDAKKEANKPVVRRAKKLLEDMDEFE
ncbi:Protein of unknown function DUF2373 [Carpediemonas membranifera]|uniref:WKF domain-containing protein n=1 Tax=Carpediemonas membranifera TaxID=201153 RepID=A0A8J6DYQ8_9EUKA|nr:Protein of unknown function DUF2373 [Carpediemonas membranifera]|eukprot:KAG9389693.1 Protein of unknown function DUF2373 [Carpediemonas membranifera]